MANSKIDEGLIESDLPIKEKSYLFLHFQLNEPLVPFVTTIDLMGQ